MFAVGILAVVLVFFAGPTQAAAVNTTELVRLCRLDTTAGGCASRFYLSAAKSTTEPVPEHDLRLFEHLFSLFLQGKPEAPPSSGNETIDLNWWLYLTRFARHCDGLPNRIYVLGRGCRCVGRPESCLEPSALSMGWEYVSFNILACLMAAAIIYSMCSTLDQYRQTKRVIAPILDANMRASQAPPNVVVTSPAIVVNQQETTTHNPSLTTMYRL